MYMAPALLLDYLMFETKNVFAVQVTLSYLLWGFVCVCGGTHLDENWH